MNHAPSPKLFNQFDLLLRGRNVNINLRLLPPKYTRSVSKERGHHQDNKYHQDSNHARAAASSIAIVAHSILLKESILFYLVPLMTLHEYRKTHTVSRAAGWLFGKNDRKLELSPHALPAEIHEPTSGLLSTIGFGHRQIASGT
jgi:hypothetical protein